MRSGGMWARLLQAVLILGVLCPSAKAGADEPKATDTRIRVAVLRLANLSEAEEAAHWQYSVTSLLEGQLERMASIRIVPDSSKRYAYCELELKPGQVLTAELARKAGRLIEAQWVVWGGYKREGTTWRLTAQLLDVASGKTATNLTAGSPDWFEVVSPIRKRMLLELKLAASPDEEERMSERLTKSAEAFELTSQTVADVNRGGVNFESLETARRALSLNRECARTRLVLALVLAKLGEWDEATAHAKAVVEELPDSPLAHEGLGQIFLARGILPLAETEFREASQLKPDWEEPHLQLGAVYAARSGWEQAALSLRKATELAPHHANARAELARVYRKRNDRQRALAELKTAERLARCDTDPQLPMLLARSYETLGDFPTALRYYEKGLAGTTGGRLDSWWEKFATQRVAELQARLTPRFLTAATPRSFTADQLKQALTEKLTRQELELVENPLVGSPELETWAKRLVGDARDGMEKARRLFTGMQRSFDPPSAAKPRTAREAFRDWSNPKAGLSQQDYAHLYVATVRHVGLQAFVVFVDKDDQGRSASLYCVGVFIDGKLLLIDVASQWFGAPYRSYQVKDDLEAIAAFLALSKDKTREDIGMKLVPGWAQPYFWVVVSRVNRGERDLAREPLRMGLKVDTNSVAAVLAQGSLEFGDENWGAAVAVFERFLKMNPDYSDGHFLLGYAYYKQRKNREARAELRAYLNAGTDLKYTDEARGILATLGRE